VWREKSFRLEPFLCERPLRTPPSRAAVAKMLEKIGWPAVARVVGALCGTVHRIEVFAHDNAEHF